MNHKAEVERLGPYLLVSNDVAVSALRRKPTPSLENDRNGDLVTGAASAISWK
jgi:hypothetical protein